MIESLINSENSEDEGIEFNKIYSPKIVELIKKSKTLYSIYVDEDIDFKIVNIVELQNHITDVQGVTDALREYINEQPLKWKSKYTKNLVKLRNKFKGYGSKLTSVRDKG